jgi:hypothetical protein
MEIIMYDITFDDINKDVPKENKDVIFTAMGLIHKERNIMNSNDKDDYALAVESLYFGMLKNNNEVSKALSEIGIEYEDIADNLDVLLLKEEQYREIYDRYYRGLISFLYSKMKSQDPFLNLTTFHIEYLSFFLHDEHFGMFDIVKNIIEECYGEYGDLFKQSFYIAVELLDNKASTFDEGDLRYENVPKSNITILIPMDNGDIEEDAPDEPSKLKKFNILRPKRTKNE